MRRGRSVFRHIGTAQNTRRVGFRYSQVNPGIIIDGDEKGTGKKKKTFGEMLKKGGSRVKILKVLSDKGPT